MSIPKNVFCQVMCIAYKINHIHPDWSMDKCIEYAVKGAYNLTDIKRKKDHLLREDRSNDR
jgi:hypothetical protein